MTPIRSPETVLAAVKRAITAMTWLSPADAGMVALALEYAGKIDASDDTKTLGWLGQSLTAVLKSLGGAPAERKALGLEDTVRGKLAELRNARR